MQIVEKLGGKLSVLIFLGGFIALVLLFTKPLEWLLFNGRNFKANICAWRRSKDNLGVRMGHVVRGSLRKHYPPKSNVAEGWFRSSYDSPYLAERKAKAFGAFYFLLSILVLYHLHLELIEKSLSTALTGMDSQILNLIIDLVLMVTSMEVFVWILMGIVPFLIFMVSIWAFLGFRESMGTVGSYYFFQNEIPILLDLRRFVPQPEIIDIEQSINYLARARLAMDKNDWNDTVLEIELVKTEISQMIRELDELPDIDKTKELIVYLDVKKPQYGLQ